MHARTTVRCSRPVPARPGAPRAEPLEPRRLMAGVAADLDPAFSTDGKAAVDFFDLDDAANDVAVLAGGEVIVAGSAATERSVRSGFALAKFNANGTLDKSFGPGGFDGDGRVTTTFPLADPIDDDAINIAAANRVLVLPGGKILAAGVAPAAPLDDPLPPDQFTGGRDFALVRYHPDGSLDTSFGGGDGIVLTSFSGVGGVDEAFGLAVGPGGKIVLAGVARLGRASSAAIARFDPDGSLDDTFSPGGADGDGKLILNLGNRDFTSATDCVVLGDGRVLLACLAGENARSDFALVRLSPTGAVERQRTLAFLGSEFETAVTEASPRRLALIPNGGGDFYAAGAATLADRQDTDFAVARFNPDFSLDTNFGGGDGRVTVDFGGRQDVANDLAVLPNGKVLLAGHTLRFETGAGGLPDGLFALARLNANGTLDGTFDEGSGGLRGDGRRTTRFNGTAFGSGLDVAPDGKYVVAGAVRFEEEGEDFSESDMAVARYLGETAAPAPDGDDQISEAPRFGVGQNVSRTINAPGDVDMVRFSVTAGQRVLLDVDQASGSTLDSFLRLFNAQGTQLASNDDGGSDAARGNAALTFRFTTGGTYFVGVSAKRNTRYNPVTGRGDVDGGSRGAYVLKLRNAPAAAGMVTAPAPRSGDTASEDDDDEAAG